MSENSCRDLKMERFRWLLREQPRSNYHFQLISNLFSTKFCRTFEITSYWNWEITGVPDGEYFTKKEKGTDPYL